jgi:hypothetical protein
MKTNILFIISRLSFLKVRYFSDKSCRESRNTHFVFSNFFFRKSCCLWDNVKNIVQRCRLQMKIRHMRNACWITKATDTQQVYAILLFYCNNGCTKWLRHYATNQQVAGSIPDGVIGIFHWHNPTGRTMALGSTQPLTEMSTRCISLG